MTLRATIAEPVEPTVESVFGSYRWRQRDDRRSRHEWRLIPIGLRGKVLRVLVVYVRQARGTMQFVKPTGPLFRAPNLQGDNT